RARASREHRAPLRRSLLCAREIVERGIDDPLLHARTRPELEDLGERVVVALEIAEPIELEVEHAHALTDVNLLFAVEVDGAVPRSEVRGIFFCQRDVDLAGLLKLTVALQRARFREIVAR